jgi:hypothetical protein
MELVGTGRFELPTPRTPSECSTRLSHVPTLGNPLHHSWPQRIGVDSKILHQPPPFSFVHGSLFAPKNGPLLPANQNARTESNAQLSSKFLNVR